MDKSLIVALSNLRKICEKTDLPWVEHVQLQNDLGLIKQCLEKKEDVQREETESTSKDS